MCGASECLRSPCGGVTVELFTGIESHPLLSPTSISVRYVYGFRQAIINVMRACSGLAPENHMLLEHRLSSEIMARRTPPEEGVSEPAPKRAKVAE